MSRFGVDPLSVDRRVLASMPPDVRDEIEAEISLLLEQGESTTQKTSKKREIVKEKANEESCAKKRKYRQAKENADGSVELLCFKCRRAPAGSQAQALLTRYFGQEKKKVKTDEYQYCSRCRTPLHVASLNKKSVKTKQCPPQITRLKAYKRLASEHGVPFALTDGEALALMRMSCFGCGALPGEDGNGISRLRDWTGFDASSATKKYMGPFSRQNCITACATCNLMKGYRRIPAFVECCRTIATHHAKSNEETFGSYPHRFRNNISRRSRSSYITLSSTHTKTHCLTNHQFNQIVSQPCAYCGKPSNPPHHYNGLDRLDSQDRVYRPDNVVSSCGTCNIMKYTHSLDFFINHCRRVAIHHKGIEFPPDDDDEQLPDDFVEVKEENEEHPSTTDIIFPDIDDDDDDDDDD
uniref:Uncharacterized protein n=1 Tax=Aureoumbra lagunensis TaxID=44058 RepID=A0A7S3NM32_9STRA